MEIRVKKKKTAEKVSGLHGNTTVKKYTKSNRYMAM
jgi:type IV secretory pathway TraG/TraD family ATPase VirD4